MDLGSGTNAVDVEEFGLPLKKLEQVEKSEELLTNRQKFNSLVIHLSHLGGINSKEIASRIMSAVMTSPVAKCYNWTGKGQLSKRGLKDLKLAAVLKEAAKRHSVTEASMERHMVNWLKNAKDRDGGRQERANKKNDQEQQKARKRIQLATLVSSSEDSD